jgi:hypothetical protein
MKYQAQLTPWVIYQVANESHIAIQRFRRRNDADAYAKMLQQTKPALEFTVEFDTESVTSRKADKALAAI